MRGGKGTEPGGGEGTPRRGERRPGGQPGDPGGALSALTFVGVVHGGGWGVPGRAQGARRLLEERGREGNGGACARCDGKGAGPWAGRRRRGRSALPLPLLSLPLLALPRRRHAPPVLGAAGPPGPSPALLGGTAARGGAEGRGGAIRLPRVRAAAGAGGSQGRAEGGGAPSRAGSEQGAAGEGRGGSPGAPGALGAAQRGELLGLRG